MNHSHSGFGYSSTIQPNPKITCSKITYLPEQEVTEPHFSRGPYQDVRVRRVVAIEALIEQGLRDITKAIGKQKHTSLCSTLLVNFHAQPPSSWTIIKHICQWITNPKNDFKSAQSHTILFWGVGTLLGLNLGPWYMPGKHSNTISS